MKEVSLDLLGGVQYPKRVLEIVKYVKDKYPEVKLNIGLIAHASGWNTKKYKNLIPKICQFDNVSSIRLHGLWKDAHNFTTDDIKITKPIGAELNRIAIKFPRVKFYYSPALEHRMTNALATLYKNEHQFPNLTFVNCYISGGASLTGVVNEVHHSLSKHSGQYIHSFDGLDQLDVDMNLYKNTHKKALYFYSWSWFCNLKCSKKDTTKREDRKLVPQMRMIDVMILQQLHTYPIKHKLEKGRIYKAYAEAHLDPKGQADSRSYSITFLTTGKPKEILFKSKGKVLLRLTDSGSTHGSQRIYRNLHNPFAVDLWRDALKLNKKGMVNVWEDKNQVGMVLPIFRCGDYRNID